MTRKHNQAPAAAPSQTTSQALNHALGHADANASPEECCEHIALEAEGMPAEEMLYDLADLFKIFADTTRIKILYALMEQDLCVAHLAGAIGGTQSAVSHQLRILKQARLVRFRREGKNVIYSLSDDHVHTILAEGMSHLCE